MLSDGALPIPVQQILVGATLDEIANMLSASFQKAVVHTSVNSYLMKSGKHVVLVDTGAGQSYGPTVGKFGANLRSVGLAPEDIANIFLTHIHGDHIGGLVAGDRLVFPHATVHVDATELKFWLSEENRAAAPVRATASFDNASMIVNRQRIGTLERRPKGALTQF